MRTAAVVFCLSLLASPALAQRTYIDHRTYTPPSGEDPIAFGARLYPGMPVEEKPGFTWQHDGRWYHALAGTPTPDAPAPVPPTPMSEDCVNVDPYKTPRLAWVCQIERDLKNPDAPSNFHDGQANKTLPVVGRRYRHVYASLAKVIVLSTGLNTRGHLVVTVEHLSGDHAGQIETFINGTHQTPFEELARF